MKYTVWVCYEVYGMRMLWSMVCGRKIGLCFEILVFGTANLSSTWEDCSSNARSIHNNNNNNNNNNAAAAAEVKLRFLNCFLFKMRRWESRGDTGQVYGKSWHLTWNFYFSPKMWGKSARFVQKLKLKSWFSGTSWPARAPPGLFNKFCRFLPKKVLENLGKFCFFGLHLICFLNFFKKLVYSCVIFPFYGRGNFSNFE
jgi:hypothetical protein